MDRQLTILTPLHSFAPGGVERVALRLNAAWQGQGIRAIVVIGRDEGDKAGLARIDYQSFAQPGFSTAWCETLWMIARLPGAIRRLRPDILFCAGNTYAVVMVAMRLILGRRCPRIVAKVSNDLERNDLGVAGGWFYRLWLRVQGRFIDAFVGMAEPMRAEIADAMDIAPAKVAIVEDPALSVAELAHHAAGRRTQKTTAGRNFIAAGRLVPQKNFALLLRAFAQCAARQDRLTIIGEGPERARLDRLAKSLGIAEQVSMPGHRASVAADFAEADTFLLSSDYEGVPAVVIEALASGLPIVATDCSVSMNFLLDHGRFGLLVPTGDVQAFAKAMDRSGTHRFCVEAAAAHAARFTVERAAGKYLAVFHDGATQIGEGERKSAGRRAAFIVR
jgi:glycosyltransferase involved in cell wall biosynthesis